jgi:hypothetical protein
LAHRAIRHVRRLRGPRPKRIESPRRRWQVPSHSNPSASTTQFHSSDYCVTTRRRCDVVCWQIWLQKSDETGLEGVVLTVRDRPSRCGLICNDAVEDTRT